MTFKNCNVYLYGDVFDMVVNMHCAVKSYIISPQVNEQVTNLLYCVVVK